MNILSFPKFTLLVEGTHVGEEDAALIRWHVVEINVWACFSHGRCFDNNQTMLLCWHLRRWHGAFFTSSDGMYCSVFSNSRIGNSFRYRWRHVTLTHRKPLVVILLTWFPCVVRCSVRSSGRLLITHAIMFSIPAFLGASAAFSGFMVSSLNFRSMVCRENAWAS